MYRIALILPILTLFAPACVSLDDEVDLQALDVENDSRDLAQAEEEVPGRPSKRSI